MDLLRRIGLGLTLQFLWLSYAVALPAAQAAQADERPAPPSAEVLRQVHTILLAGKATTWLDLPAPPYNIAVTLKMKLERAGFRAVLDPREPFDAVLVIRYDEAPGREYGRMEQGTVITCDLALRHPKGELWRTDRFEAATTWPAPVGSPYWDAVQNLEEQPYYYYFGDLLKGWLGSQQDAVAVFSEMLRQPPIRIATDGNQQITGQVAANQHARLNAIAELGRLKDQRALDTLRYLIGRADQAEREAAEAALQQLRPTPETP